MNKEVNCRWCERPLNHKEHSIMHGGVECFDCWVLRSEIQKRPEMAQRMLKEINHVKP